MKLLYHRVVVSVWLGFDGDVFDDEAFFICRTRTFSST